MNTNLRSLEALIDNADPAWPLVEEWIADAVNKVEVLPVDAQRAKDALYYTQVTTRSPMGAIIFNTGGLLIDDGWIRVLGSGADRLTRTLPAWNDTKTALVNGAPTFLLIADDVLGGCFLLNGGGLGDDFGRVYYFAPDTLAAEPLDLTYTEFLHFCFSGDIADFYAPFRWDNWRAEVAALSGDMAYSCYPPLCTVEGKDMRTVSRKAVPMEELYQVNIGMRGQLSGE